MGFRFRLYRKDLPGTPDLVFPKYRLAAVANQQANLRGTNVEKMIQSAKRKALDTLKEDCLAERMAERRCKHQVYNHILSNTTVPTFEA